jgi:hypothetical protein
VYICVFVCVDVVCKFLRAFRNHVFVPGHANYNPDYSPWMDADISGQECFELLSHFCCERDQPSFAIFHSFLTFMYTGFTGVNK